MSAILGFGLATPALVADQATATEHALARCATTSAQRAFLRRVYSRSRVDTRGAVILRDGLFPEPTTETDKGPGTGRRLAEYNAEAPGLAENACRDALRASGTPAESITHLVTASCTGFAAPGVDIALIERLGLPPDTQRTNVGFMGCHAAINSLRIADAITSASSEARALVCCVELCSLHFQYGWRSDQIVSNALFADGAGACVVAASTAAQVRLLGTGSCLVPGTQGAMSWRIGDTGFEMGLSPETPALIEQSLATWLDSWLTPHGRTRADIAHWAVHPGGPKVLDATERALSLAPDALAPSRAVLASHGNMSSATLLFILERMLSTGARGLIVALAFGPGLTIEAALIEVP